MYPLYIDPELDVDDELQIEFADGETYWLRHSDYVKIKQAFEGDS